MTNKERARKIVQTYWPLLRGSAFYVCTLDVAIEQALNEAERRGAKRMREIAASVEGLGPHALREIRFLSLPGDEK